MNISSTYPITSSTPASPPPAPAPLTVPPEQIKQHQQLLQAAKSVNSSGTLGENQLVFVLDRATHRVIMRLQDRNTHEVVLQVPPEYVLRLAQSLKGDNANTIQSDTDT
jgi:uncharacterized FlaG/YvyC family protein